MKKSIEIQVYDWKLRGRNLFNSCKDNAERYFEVSEASKYHEQISLREPIVAAEDANIVLLHAQNRADLLFKKIPERVVVVVYSGGDQTPNWFEPDLSSRIFISGVNSPENLNFDIFFREWSLQNIAASPPLNLLHSFCPVYLTAFFILCQGYLASHSLEPFQGWNAEPERKRQTVRREYWSPVFGSKESGASLMQELKAISGLGEAIKMIDGLANALEKESFDENSWTSNVVDTYKILREKVFKKKYTSHGLS